MKKYSLFVICSILLSASAFAANTQAVFSCHPQALALMPTLPGSAAVLCADVKSTSDIQAVINCFKEATANTGVLYGNPKAAVILCSKVTE